MPKIVDHDQYRKELLLKAFDLFAKRGYGSLTMRQLAQELGVSTGTLYHYFQSKEDLFLKLMEELAQQDFREAELVLTNSGNRLEERIAAVFDWIEQREGTFVKQILVSISFYQEQHNSKELLEASQIINDIEEGYRQLCHQYLGIADPDLMNFIDNLIEGITINRLFCPEQTSWRKQSQLLGKMLRAYIQTYHREGSDGI
ncbi:MAG: TetR/AcrR family transcriptional regulator [Thermostichus sp. DG02_5_bins_236]